tara:strand:- start:4420 stop:5100 length:681 start_codon:yes stop_codon:yes gene_type:complete
MELGKISIILRTYNSSAFVQKALDSVAAQTLTKEQIELICVDDGSTDNTQELLDTFANAQGNVVVIKNAHLGAIKALNQGIDTATGDFIIILDSDDWLEPTALEKLYKPFETDPDLGFSYCDYFEKTREEVKTVTVDNLMDTIAGGILYKKSVLQDAGPYDEAIVLPEYDIIIKAQEKCTSIHVSEPLFTYNRRPDSITGDKTKVEEAKKYLLEKHGKIIEDMRSY